MGSSHLRRRPDGPVARHTFTPPLHTPRATLLLRRLESVMRPPGTAAELERRRRLALSHLQSGHAVPVVAEFLGVSERAVYLWQAAARRHGVEGVKAKPP